MLMDWHIRGPMGKAKVQVDDQPAVVRDGWFEATWAYRQTTELARDLAGKHRVSFEISSEKKPTKHRPRISYHGPGGRWCAEPGKKQEDITSLNRTSAFVSASRVRVKQRHLSCSMREFRISSGVPGTAYITHCSFHEFCKLQTPSPT